MGSLVCCVAILSKAGPHGQVFVRGVGKRRTCFFGGGRGIYAPEKEVSENGLQPRALKLVRENNQPIKNCDLTTRAGCPILDALYAARVGLTAFTQCKMRSHHPPGHLFVQQPLRAINPKRRIIKKAAIPNTPRRKPLRQNRPGTIKYPHPPVFIVFCSPLKQQPIASNRLSKAPIRQAKDYKRKSMTVRRTSISRHCQPLNRHPAAGAS